MIGTSVAVGILAQKLLDVFGILADTLLVAVVAVNENHQMTGVNSHLRTLMVAGGSANTTQGITVHGESFDIYHATTNALVRLSFTANTQSERVALELVSIEPANAVAIGDAGQVDKVNKRVALVEFFPLKQTAYQRF